jgi:hypothetical protein
MIDQEINSCFMNARFDARHSQRFDRVAGAAAKRA